MKKIVVLLALVAIVLNACKNNEKETVATDEIGSENHYDKIKELQWMLGTWTNKTETEFSQETWTRENDSTFTGYSFTEINGEVVFAETMALELKANQLELTVATAKNKDEKPVTFKLIPSTEGQFTFENKKHDFPQRIIYTNPAKDSIHAWVEGDSNGEFKKVDFHFSKN